MEEDILELVLGPILEVLDVNSKLTYPRVKVLGIETCLCRVRLLVGAC